MGLTSSMYVAITGLNMSQAGMSVASHNIANVNTPNYSRQRLNLETNPSWRGGSWGQMGTGVNAQNITRFHDEFLTRSMVNKNSEYTYYAAQKSAIDSLEAFFNESDGNGINQAMNDFFALWDSVADAPELDAIRVELVAMAETLASQVATRRADMDSLRQDINDKVETAVADINTLIQGIAGLNQQIMTTEDPSRNQQANDLRDSRDALLLQLSELIDIDYWEDPTNGAVNISFSNGPVLVSNTSHYEVGAETDDSGDIRIIANNRRTSPPWPEDVTSRVSGGAVGGWLEFRDTTMREMYIQYESWVDQLTFQVNNQHAQGAGYELYDDSTSTSKVSNHPSYIFSFGGSDNDLKLTALVPHLTANEPYNPQSDPENIGVRFVKSTEITNKITSSVTWNDQTGLWEATVVLPTDSNGNVTCTAEDVIRHINNERSNTARGVATLPPTTVDGQYKIGDFIGAQAASNNNWTGKITFAGPSSPSGQDQYATLNRSLANVMEQGHHLSYGTDPAAATTTLKHTDNNVTFTALESGAAGERIAIEYVTQTGASQELSVSVYTDVEGTKCIRVNLGTNAAGETNTSAGDIVNLINTDPATRDLVTANTPEGQKGQGIVTAMDPLYLDRSGSFDLVTYNAAGEPTINKITVDPTDTLQDIVSRIGATFDKGVQGVRAEVITDQNGQSTLRIIADSENGVEYGFRNDSSGALAVLGFNNIFTGDSSSNIGVNQLLVDNPKLVASARIDVDGKIAPGNNTNALDMADLQNRRFNFYKYGESTLGTGFNSFYSEIGTTNKNITTQHDFLYNVVDQLQAQQDTLAGVNLDEELSDVLRYQYMYQAAAKIVSAIDEMMNTLLAMR